MLYYLSLLLLVSSNEIDHVFSGYQTIVGTIDLSIGIQVAEGLENPSFPIRFDEGYRFYHVRQIIGFSLPCRHPIDLLFQFLIRSILVTESIEVRQFRRSEKSVCPISRIRIVLVIVS